ncbi:MAG: sulfate transporter CysZ [Porticoccaceae bacterium]|nr:sulfate transporter CysZ [Porticoccaceae bacterium]
MINRQTTFMETTSGPSLLLEGLGRLKDPDIRWLVIVPLLVNIFLFTLVTSVLAQWIENWITGFISDIPQWLAWLTWLIWALFIVLAFAVYAFTFTLLANLIGSPFYGVIAQRVIASEINTSEGDTLNIHTATSKGFFATAGKSVLRELQLIGYFIPRTVGIGILTLVLSFAPVVNLLAPIIAACWTAWCLGLQYLDYAADSEEITFAALRLKLKKRRTNTLGFGFATMLVSAIPVVNLVMLPASVVAGSLLWCRQHRSID